MELKQVCDYIQISTDEKIRNDHVRPCEDRSVMARPPGQLPSAFQYHVPASCYFPHQRYPVEIGHRGRRFLSWELYSSASLVHLPVDLRPHPHESKPLASRRSRPASLDPNFLPLLHSTCWATARATRPEYCVGKLSQHPDVKGPSGVLGSPVRKDSNKEAKALNVEGIVDIA